MCKLATVFLVAGKESRLGHGSKAPKQAIELKRVTTEYPGEWQDHAHGQPEHFKLTP